MMVTVGYGHVHQLQVILVEDGREESVSGLIYLSSIVLLGDTKRNAIRLLLIRTYHNEVSSRTW